MHNDTAMHWLRTLLLLATVLSIVGSGSCQHYNSKTPKDTYVGTIEKSIRLIMKSGRMINDGIATIREDLRDTALNIPFLRARALNNRTTIADIFNPFKSKIKAIVPGTCCSVFIKFEIEAIKDARFLSEAQDTVSDRSVRLLHHEIIFKDISRSEFVTLT